jgi:PIN domain nuclease of toxin-antitoxin system
MGARLTALLLDTHVVLWLDAEPDRLSTRASEAIDAAEELAVASITWFELAWLVEHGRILTAIPLRTWLSKLAGDVRSIPISPAIAATAVDLRASFPADPADRLIYATAIEHGLRIVTKDERMHRHPHPRPMTIW